MKAHVHSRGAVRGAVRSISLPFVAGHGRPARLCLARSSSPAAGQTDLKNVRLVYSSFAQNSSNYPLFSFSNIYDLTHITADWVPHCNLNISLSISSGY